GGHHRRRHHALRGRRAGGARVSVDATIVAAAIAALPDRATAGEGSLGPRSAVGPALQPTLAELSVPGRHTDQVPHPPADALSGIPAAQLRAVPAALPELNEPGAVRDFTAL